MSHVFDVTPVAPGQVWADNDHRADGRMVRVVSVDDTHARVAPVTSSGRLLPGRRTRVRLDRFRPTATGYRLVEAGGEDPPGA